MSVRDASSDHYAFARGDGAALYDPTLGITTLIRTIGLSRERAGFVVIQDRVTLSAPRTIDQVLHAMRPAPETSNSDSPWLKLANFNGLLLGVRLVAPSQYRATIATQISNQFRENMHDDGKFGVVRVAPTGPQTNTVLLEVLWPTTSAAWSERPQVQPLDNARPQRGFFITLGSSTESWIFNLSGTKTDAGGLSIQRNDRSGSGLRRSNNVGATERLFIQGADRLADQNGARTLIDLGSSSGVLEIDFAGTEARLSGSAGVLGVKFLKFFGSEVTAVIHRGKNLQWTRSQGLVTITGMTS